MIEFDMRRRGTWLGAVAVLSLLALTVPWALSRLSPPPPDDPRELLKGAAAQAATDGARPTGKSIEVSGKTSSGEPARARLEEVRTASGKKGYGLRLPGELKEGEKTTLNLPGGGNIVIGRPPGGAVIRAPGAGENSAPGASSPR